MTAVDPFVDVSVTGLGMTPADQVRRASARIRGYCGWHIWPSLTMVKRLDTHGGPELLLPTLYLTDVGPVTLTDDNSDVPASSFAWSEAGMIRLLGGCWPDGYRTVQVEFTHGYTDLPEDLIEPTISIAKRMPAQLATVTQESAGGVNRVYGGLLAGGFSSSSGLTISEELALTPYRLPKLP